MRSIKLLIDGYNVLFQSQLTGNARGPGWLERARKRLLLALLKGLSEEEVATTTVVFDASRAVESGQDFLFDSRLEVRFASNYAEADDLLEELIRSAPQPKLLSVISSDHRIRRCARARRAQSLDSEAFLELLETANLQRKHTPPIELRPTKEEPLAASEVEYWLNEFGGTLPEGGERGGKGS